MAKPLRLGVTLETHCSACHQTSEFEVIHLGKPVHHLRCGSCRTVQAALVDALWVVQTVERLADLLAHLPETETIPYAPTRSFRRGQLLEHPRFAVGYVIEVHQPGKVDVLFEAGRKTLACVFVGGPEPAPPVAQRPPRRARRRSAKARPARDTASTSAASSEVGPKKTTLCPKCGRSTHPYNLRQRPTGEIVGCIHCA